MNMGEILALSLNSKVQFSLDSINQSCAFKHLKLMKRQQYFAANCIHFISIFLIRLAGYGGDTDYAGVCKDLQKNNYT